MRKSNIEKGSILITYGVALLLYLAGTIYHAAYMAHSNEDFGCFQTAEKSTFRGRVRRNGRLTDKLMPGYKKKIKTREAE